MKELLQPKNISIRSNIIAHILLWSVIFILPNFIVNTDRIFNWTFLLRSLPEMFGYMLVFYLNYFFLIEKFLFNGKTKTFILCNLLIICAVAVLMYYGRDWLDAILPGRGLRRGGRRAPSLLWFVVRDATMLFLMCGLSMALKITTRWFQVENERRELTKAKMEAELQNLKNQISPHFLLNTLNNIYALIEFNPPKAQQAVMDLSRMLRHLLYDNDKMYVPLRQEADFMLNYIELMRIRLADNVELKTDFSYSEISDTKITPLVFISLIENAFKHGVSGDKPSSIHIELVEYDDGKVLFSIANSYFPKTETDKSGSGIGLELARKRLDLIYPNGYEWTTDIQPNRYFTKLIIDTTKNNEI